MTISLLSFLTPQFFVPNENNELVGVTRGPRLMGRLIVLPRRMFDRSVRPVPRRGDVGRRAAIAQARHETQFQDPEFLVELTETGRSTAKATIWSWDKAEIEALSGSRETRAIPEPLLRMPGGDGARLIQAIDGYDGEVWVGGNLIASRWWPKEPNEIEWREFMVGARSPVWPEDASGQPIEFDRPIAQAVPWRSNLIWVRRGWHERLESVTASQIAIAALLLSAAPIGFEIARAVSLEQKAVRLQASLEAERIRSEPWLQLRRRAYFDLSQIDTMTSYGDPAALVFALMDLGHAFGTETPAIDQVAFTDGELRVTLANNADSSVVDLVSSLENSRNWDQVRYDATSRQIIGRISMDISLYEDSTEAVEP